MSFDTLMPSGTLSIISLWLHPWRSCSNSALVYYTSSPVRMLPSSVAPAVADRAARKNFLSSGKLCSLHPFDHVMDELVAFFTIVIAIMNSTRPFSTSTSGTSSKISIKPWQATGVHWMLEQEKSPVKGGILADACGLGKTLDTLLLVHWAKRTTRVVSPRPPQE